MLKDNPKTEKVNCNLCGGSGYSLIYCKNGYNIVQCKRCGLVFVSPRLTAAASKELYDGDYFKGSGFDESLDYQREFHQKSSRTGLEDWDLGSIRQLIKTDGLRLLDVGSGMGLFLKKASSLGFKAEGLELSSYASEFSRSQGLIVHNASIDDYRIPAETYDAVSMREVIEHLPDPLSALKKIHSSLKKGGVLFVATGNFSCVERKIRKASWHYFMPEGHLYVFSHSTIKKMLIEAGFSDVRVTRQGDMLMNLALRLNFMDPKKYMPSGMFRRFSFMLLRGVNHFISSGLRVYALK